MRSDFVAERILRRCTSLDRAASIVGDLVEIRPQKGLLWFWLSVAGAVVRLLWRPALALVAAFYAHNWAMSLFQTFLYGARTHHHIPDDCALVSTLFALLATNGATLWLILVYAALRYSTLDTSIRLAAVLTATATGIVFLWWRPVTLVLLLSALIAMVGAFLFSRNRRHALITVLTPVLVCFAGLFLSAALGSLWQEFLYKGPWGSEDFRQHPSAIWLMFCLVAASVWGTTATYSALHNHFARNRSHRDTGSIAYSES